MTRKSPALPGGPSLDRSQHNAFVRDVMTPKGAPIIARHRVRTILTSMSVRRAILEELADKTEAVKLRSIRRRLTALDRALTDKEAEMLERLTTCINSLSNVGCIDYLRSEVRSSPYGRIPFSDHKKREITGMTYVLTNLSLPERNLVADIARRLDTVSQCDTRKADEDYIAQVKLVCQKIVHLYEGMPTKDKDHKQGLRPLRNSKALTRSEKRSPR